MSIRRSKTAKNSKAEFWNNKHLSAMTNDEWEELCDGCARCCVHKIEDIDTGECFSTNVACKLLDISTGRCSDYLNRHKIVPECAHLDFQAVLDLTWLPDSCAYKRLSVGKDLPDWHPLITGDSESTHSSGMSVRNKVISEDDAGDLIDHII